MANIKEINCNNCGASLDTGMNKAHVFCQFCGTKIIIESEQMQTSIQIDGSINLNAKTNMESIIASADYVISMKQYQRGNEILLSAIFSGCSDYRVFIRKAMIDLNTDENCSLFESLENLALLEKKQEKGEVSEAICGLMKYRGCNGVIALHNATFHERFDMVKFCVEHGADVNSIAGMNCVSPISIMFVPISSSLSKIDGTPFKRNKAVVKQIRNYLLAHGAKDKFRFGY